MKGGNRVSCPACGTVIKVEEDSYVGDIMYCPDCSIELEVVKIDPLKVREVKSLVKGFGEEFEEDDSLSEDMYDDEIDKEDDDYLG